MNKNNSCLEESLREQGRKLARSGQGLAQFDAVRRRLNRTQLQALYEGYAAGLRELQAGRG